MSLWAPSGVTDLRPLLIITIVVHFVAIQSPALVFVCTPHWGVRFPFRATSFPTALTSSSSVHISFFSSSSVLLRAFRIFQAGAQILQLRPMSKNRVSFYYLLFSGATQCQPLLVFLAITQIRRVVLRERLGERASVDAIWTSSFLLCYVRLPYSTKTT